MDGLVPRIVWPMLTESQIWAILLACVMMCADVLVGFLGACIRHDIQSSKMRAGLMHKIMVLIIIAVAYLLGVGLGYVSGIDVTIPSTEVVCGYVIVMELASVLENVGKAWPEFSGTQLYKAFEHIVKESDNGKDSTDNVAR